MKKTMNGTGQQTLGGDWTGGEGLKVPGSLILLSVFLFLGCAGLIVTTGETFPSLHTILDAGVCMISLALAIVFWNIQAPMRQGYLRAMALTFWTTFILDLAHVLVLIEWTGPLAVISEYSTFWRPASWPPAAHALPIGIMASMLILRTRRSLTTVFTLGLPLLAIGLLVTFSALPRYAEPGVLGVTRPSLIFAPLLWGLALLAIWRFKHSRIPGAIIIVAPLFVFSQIAILYSRAPHDHFAMVAHLLKLSGYLSLLLLLMQMGTQDTIGRVRAEQELRSLNTDLEARVKERTEQLELANRNDRRLAEIVQGMSEACFSLDSNWRFTFANDRANVLLLHTREQMIGNSIWDVFHELVGTPMEETLRRTMAERIPVAFEAFSPIAKRWLDIRLFPAGDGLSAFLLDIDARKKMEAIVAEREVQLRTLLDFLPVGISVMDENRKITYHNPALLRIARLTADELHTGAAKARKFIDRNGEVLAFERLPSVRALKENEIQSEEIGIQTEDGKTTWALVSAVPVAFSDWRVINVTTDITQHREAEEKLRFNEEILSETGRIAKVGGWMFDPATGKGSWTEEVGRIHDLDPEKETSVELGLSFYTESSRPFIEAAIKDAIELGKPYDLELEIISAKGIRKWIRTIGHPLVVAGKVVRVRGSFQDISEHKQVQAALQAGEARLAGIISSAMDGIITIDSKHSITLFNAAAEKMFGISSAEAIGTNLNRLMPNRFHSAHLPYVQEFGAAETISRNMGHMGRIFGLRADGTEFPIEASISQIEISGERLFTVILRDISERQLAENALRESEAVKQELGNRLTTTLENMNDGFFTIDRSWRFTYINKEFENLLQRPRAQIIGKGIWDEFKEAIGGPSYRNYHVAMTENRAVSFEEFFPPVGLWFEASAYPTADGLAVYFRDITGKKQAAEKLRESEELFSTAFHSSPAAIAINRRRDLINLEVNESFLNVFECKHHDIVGHTLIEAGLLDLETLKMLRDQLNQTGSVEGLEVSAKTKSGRHLFLNLSIRVIELRGETCAVSTFVDITERRNAERKIQELNVDLEERVAQRTMQLEVANKELEAFSYSVSHDLRSPLRAMNGFSQALVEDYGDVLPEGAKKFAATIRASAERMGALIDDLLAFSRFGRASLKHESVDMTKMVREVFDALALEREDRRIDFVCGPIQPCQGDPALLRHVWTNLISNAVKFTRNTPEARILIASRQDDRETIYSVADNGAGFDMQYVDKLFGVFQRLHRADEFEGTGVGLAIVNRIVSRHGGRIWAESKINAGSTFYFTIPGKT
ncbi:MAG: PAS domain S-box protein [Spirochaetia bacterium]|nr:PAS domain S-box protein [Spirochaetia bacterium]